MTSVRRGLDFAVDLASAGLWSLAAFFVGTRLLSSSAGLVLALAVFVSAMTFVLGARSQEREARKIAAGACPRCGESLAMLHEHRRWDTAHQEWLAPLTTWQCGGCGFQQEADVSCDTCPTGS